MGRSVFSFKFSNFQKVQDVIKNVLYNSGFEETIVNTETIWKKGGTLLGGQCLKIDFSENQVRVYAWITPMLGGSQEFDLNCQGAIIPKKQLLRTIEQLKISIS